jgi:hypothetical protein
MKFQDQQELMAADVADALAQVRVRSEWPVGRIPMHMVCDLEASGH